MSDQTQILVKLLELKINTLNVYATTGMTWWVSSIVFCATIIGAAWIKKDELEEFPLFNLLGWFLTFFFFSIVLFGIWAIISIQRLSNEVNSIQAALQLSPELSSDSTFYTYQVAYGLGTISFGVVLVIWVRFWKHIAEEKSESG